LTDIVSERKCLRERKKEREKSERRGRVGEGEIGERKKERKERKKRGRRARRSNEGKKREAELAWKETKISHKMTKQAENRIAKSSTDSRRARGDVLLKSHPVRR